MRRVAAVLLILLVCLILPACATDREDTELDQLWRGGYGFNNPNAARLRSGQPPLNMDGSVYRP